MFHLLFKVAAIFVYLFGSLFTQDFLHLFVIIVFLVSLDFWLVKNITGRLLVGLRWWNYIDNDGQSYWIFENRFSKTENIADQQRTFLGNKTSFNPNTDIHETNSVLPSNTELSRDFLTGSNTGSDVTVFWIGIFVFTLFWFFSLFSAIFSFNIHWVVFIKRPLNFRCLIIFSDFSWYCSSIKWFKSFWLYSMSIWCQL